MNKNIEIDPIILKQKFTAAEMPVEKTYIMSIYFDDIESVYMRLRERENQHQLNCICKIKYFALIEPDKTRELNSQLTK